MDRYARLAILRQDFEQLFAMFDPRLAVNWKPTETQRLAYVQLADRVLDEIDRFKTLERRVLLQEGQLHSYVPESMLSFLREQVLPRADSLRATLDRLDPEGAAVRLMLDELSEPRKASGRVKGTFEQGIEQIWQLLENNPDWEDDHGFMPDTAYEVIESKLIDFDPDAWLERADELVPIRTGKKDVLLPMHVRLRIYELYRAYVFGCWLSVLALARAVVEYAIHDNLHKFGIDARWPALGRDPKGKEKKLTDLIEEVGSHLPALKASMEKLRGYGNDYLHPKKSQVSKESLFQRQAAAKDALSAMVDVVEGLYLAQRSAAAS